MSQEGGSVAEVLGDGGVRAYAADGGKVESGLLLEELQRRQELAVYQSQLRLVAFGIALHLRLQRWQAQLLRASTGSRYGLWRDAGDGVVRGHWFGVCAERKLAKEWGWRGRVKGSRLGFSRALVTTPRLIFFFFLILNSKNIFPLKRRRLRSF